MSRLVAFALGVCLSLAAAVFAQQLGVSTPDAYVIVGGEKYAWRLNKYTGQIVHCYSNSGTMICASAPIR